MPIEIREVVIRAVVDPKKADAKAGPKASTEAGSQMDKVVEMCVAQVMEILRQQNDR